MWFKRLFSVLLTLQLLQPVASMAHEAECNGVTNTTGTPCGSVNLDLAATEAQLTAAHHSNFSSVELQEGGTVRTVTGTDLLTPAEHIAVHQVLSSGSQTLAISAAGNAVGGSFNVASEALHSKIENLVIPRGVNALYDAGVSPEINIAGNLTNLGALSAFSSQGSITTATISATNIVNAEGATISSFAPESALNGIQTVVNSLNLTLTAVENIINKGTIASSGNLNVVAGGSIINALAPDLSGSTPVMQALNNVTLQSPNIINQGTILAQLGNINAATSQLMNSGVLQSASANVFIANLNNNLLAVNNALGTIEARGNLAMEIGLKGSLVLTGGKLSANNISFVSPEGTIEVQADRIDGVVEASGGMANIGVLQGNLSIARMDLTGDPTFYNTAGNVLINSNLSFAGQPLAIIARGDILTASGVSNIKTSSNNGNGGTITLVAGAQFTSTGPGSVVPPGGGDTTSTLTITGPSATGGRIQLTSPNISSLDSRGSTSSGNGSGGNITLVAFAGTAPNSGTISLPTGGSGGTIRSGGRGLGSNGNVTLIAGATSATSINIGNINTNSIGASGATGNISLITATPTLPGGNVTIVNGAVTGGFFSSGATQAASISTRDLTAKRSIINVVAGASFTTNSQSIVNDSGAGPGSGNGGTISISAGGEVSTGSITASGDSSGSGGNLSILAGSHITTGTLTNNAVLAGTGGIINLTSGGNITATGTMSANGAGSGTSRNGGTISLSAAGNLTTDTIRANGTGDGAGGTINFGVGGNASTDAISANGTGDGSGGTVSFGVGGSLASSGTISANGSAGLVNFGVGGTVTVGAINADALSNGSGGTIAFGAGSNIITGSLSADGNGNGSGGTINFGTSRDISTGSLSANGTGGGNGGNISFGAGGNILTGAITANGTGGGNGGSIAFGAGGNLSTGSVTANGTGGGNGGSIAFGADGNLSTGSVTANGTGGGNGGSINFGSGGTITTIGAIRTRATAGTGGTVLLSGVNLSVAASSDTSIDASSVSGSGGQVSVASTSLNPLVIGASSGPNRTRGDIHADGGLHGGRVDLRANGGQDVRAGAQITANGGTGTGGNIAFALASPGSGPLLIALDGLVQAKNNANDSGIVGFHAGAGQNLTVLGTGTVDGGESINLGNLNLTNLSLLSAPAGLLTPYPVLVTVAGELRCNCLNCLPVEVTLPLVASTPAQESPSVRVSPDHVILAQLPATDTTRDRSVEPVKPTPNPPYWLAEQPVIDEAEVWVVSFERGKPYAFTGDDASMILASPGTTFNVTASHTLAINEGNILICAGHTEVHVVTSLGKFTCAPNSTARISQSRFGLVRAAILDGNKASFEIAYRSETCTVVLSSGTEMALLDTAIASVGVADYVGDPSAPRQAGPVSGLNMERHTLVRQMTPYLDDLKSCQTESLTPVMKRRYSNLLATLEKAQEKMVEHPSRLKAHAGRQDTLSWQGTTNQTASLIPVSLAHSGNVTTPEGDGLKNIRLANVTGKCTSNTNITFLKDGSMYFDGGEAVITAFKSTQVITGKCKVWLTKGVIVAISSDASTCKIRNLCEKHLQSITVHAAQQSRRLAAGEELIIGTSARTIIPAVRADQIGRRRVKLIDLNQKQIAILISEFSIPALLTSNTLLANIYRSIEHTDKMLVCQVLKMAAALNFATASHGHFKPLNEIRQD